MIMTQRCTVTTMVACHCCTVDHLVKLRPIISGKEWSQHAGNADQSVEREAPLLPYKFKPGDIDDASNESDASWLWPRRSMWKASWFSVVITKAIRHRLAALWKWGFCLRQSQIRLWQLCYNDHRSKIHMLSGDSGSYQQNRWSRS